MSDSCIERSEMQTRSLQCQHTEQLFVTNELATTVRTIQKRRFFRQQGHMDRNDILYHRLGKISGPQLEGCEIELFWSIDSTHDEAPKRKDISPLAL